MSTSPSTGPLGKLFNPVRRYFDRYKTADAEIADIVQSLERGKATLKNDNVTLELEEDTMRDLTKQLNQQIEMATDLDSYLTTAVEKARADGTTDPERIKFVEEEVIFPLRQKILDFQQLLTVNQQGIVSMNIIRRNNLELMRAVDRAENVTVSALRVAATVAGALYNQRIVLEKVNTLNAATNEMIASTSRMLKEQGAEIQVKATEANISIDTLKASFADTIQALEDISTYKQAALPRIKQTIAEFQAIADEGQKHIDRIEARDRQLGPKLAKTPSNCMSSRFARTELLLGEHAMATLADSRVAVFGIGGVGGFCAEALARSGVGAIDLVDHDKVGLTNLNRQIIALHSAIGRLKVEVAAERIRDINPACHVTTHKCFFLPETADQIDFSQYDYILDCVDTITAKLQLIERAHAAGTPIISSMGTANKLDPTAFEVADIYKTSICPLAKIIRKECRKRGIKNLKVVYSREPAVQPSEEAQKAYLEAADESAPDKFGRAGIPASNAFVPPAAGLILASEVVKDLIR